MVAAGVTATSRGRRASYARHVPSLPFRHGSVRGGLVKRVLPLLLLLGALFGLLGQQTAAAAASIPVAAAASAAAMSADCMEMMGQPPAKPKKKPCTGLTLDCISAMGCALPLTRDPLPPLFRAPMVTAQIFWPTSAVLVGHDLVPEPHPPSILS